MSMVSETASMLQFILIYVSMEPFIKCLKMHYDVNFTSVHAAVMMMMMMMLMMPLVLVKSLICLKTVVTVDSV